MLAPNNNKLQSWLWWAKEVDVGDGDYSLEAHVEQFRSQGKVGVAEALQNINAWRHVTHERIRLDNHRSRNGGVLILRRGVITLIVMLALILFATLLSPVLATGLVFLTATTMFLFAYAFWVETRVAILSPHILFYCMLLSTSLAILVLVSPLFH